MMALLLTKMVCAFRMGPHLDMQARTKFLVILVLEFSKTPLMAITVLYLHMDKPDQESLIRLLAMETISKTEYLIAVTFFTDVTALFCSLVYI
ncbi:unnamed protein product [Hydatigera taeniaeformis]|uniref:G_PROTEIN_RECEP_F1_2 domain-containing protein n=1 Tax=Hydatigena taeniaeformis TaxID=6205 RepID=A0A0R3X193_HYDTA|nr:unnamed protein product [Hydatigera taeniaeformis]